MREEESIILRESPGGGATFGEFYDRSENDSALRPDTRPRKTYSSYVNRGASPGNEVRHWLAAEAQLSADRSRLGEFHRSPRTSEVVRQNSSL